MGNTIEIICIGDELLIGRTVNTNAAWLGRTLTEAGYLISHCATVADVPADIQRALDVAFSRADAVVTTGGLGPTTDDYTVQTIADYARQPLVLHEPTLAHIDRLLRSRGRTPNAYSQRMAMLPEGATPLPNEVGAAPGLYMQLHNKPLFVLPGVPHEMEQLVRSHVLPQLGASLSADHVSYHTWHLVAAESELSALMQPILETLPADYSLAYNPNVGTLDVRLGLRTTQYDDSKQKEWAGFIARIADIVSPWCYGTGADTLATEASRQLLRRGWQLSVAESCTAGRLANELVQVSGASKWFAGGVLTYSNTLKTQLVQVSADDLRTHGAVSEAVARQMAAGVRALTQTQVGIGITGIAGPDGGTAEKPVGTVWVGVSTPQRTIARRFLFEKDRNRNMQRAANAALWMCIQELKRAE